MARKATRVSNSTSRAETLGAVTGKELAQLCSMRFAEILYGGNLWPLQRGPTTKELIWLQEAAATPLAIDHFTDCEDLWQLASGEKGLPQDKSQRLYVMSIREDRLAGWIRRWFLIPTQAMLMDGLTKHMHAPLLYDFLYTGYWRCDSSKGHRIKVRRVHNIKTTYDERDVEELDE